MKCKIDLASVLWTANSSNPGSKISCVVQLWDDHDGVLEFPNCTSLEILINGYDNPFDVKIKVREKNGIFMISDNHLWTELEVPKNECFGQIMRTWLEERMIEGIEPRIGNLTVLSGEFLRECARDGIAY